MRGGVPIAFQASAHANINRPLPLKTADSVCQALAQEAGVCVYQLAVDKVPRSGKQNELLDMFQISEKAIVDKISAILKL